MKVSIVKLIVAHAVLLAFFNTSAFAVNCENTLKITNQTSTQKIRVKEGLLYQTKLIIFPNETKTLKPALDNINVSIEYYDEETRHYYVIPNCLADFNYANKFEIVINEQGEQLNCDLTRICEFEFSPTQKALVGTAIFATVAALLLSFARRGH